MTARYEIIECEQGSPEWFEARRGLPTGSRFSDVLAQGEGIVRAKYMRQLAGEIITGKVMETYSNEKMDRGKEQEPDLRTAYCYDANVDVERIGFVKMNPQLCAVGCSPDGFVGEDGMVEFKSAEPHVLIEILEKQKTPTKQMPQIQGNLWITGRKWCDLVIGWSDHAPGWGKLPLYVTRIRREEAYMGTLSLALRAFNTELNLLVEKLRSM